jgi:hypothetical protein
MSLAGARAELVLAADDAQARSLERDDARQGRSDVQVRTPSGLANVLLGFAGPRFRTGRIIGTPGRLRALRRALRALPPELVRAAVEDEVLRSPSFARDLLPLCDDLRAADPAAVTQLERNGSPALRFAIAAARTMDAELDASGSLDATRALVRAAELLREDDALAAWAHDHLPRLVIPSLHALPIAALRMLVALVERAGIEIAVANDPRLAGVLRPAARDALERLARAASGGQQATPARAAGEPVHFVHAASPLDEADAVADLIARQIAAGTPAERIVVVVRRPRSAGSSLAAALRARSISSRGDDGGMLLDDPSLRALYDELRGLRRTGTSAEAPEAIAVRLARERELLREIVASGAQARPRARALERFLTVLRECGDDRTLSEDMLATEPLPRDDERGVQIVLPERLTTAPQLDLVLVMQAVNGLWPDESVSPSLLACRDLEAARAAGIDLGVLPDERRERERVLWELARSVAPAWGVALSCTTESGEPAIPSRLLSAAERAHIAEITPSRSPALAPWTDPPIESTPIALPQPVDVTRIHDLLLCKRRLYYAAILGLRDEPSLVMVLGTLVHEVLRRFHDRRRDFTQPLSEDDRARFEAELLALRAQVWDERAGDLPSELLREATASAVDARLRAYASYLVRSAAQRPFAVREVECELETTLGGVWLVGRADRVDACADGTLRVVDYKWSRFDADRRLGPSEKSPRSWMPNVVASARAPGLRCRGSKVDLADPQPVIYAHALARRERRELGNVQVIVLYLSGSEEEGLFDAPAADMLAGERGAQIAKEIVAVVEADLAAHAASREAARWEETEETGVCHRCRFNALCDGALR